jgi:hypothetical protein
MGPESHRRPKTKPHLVIRIKEGWEFDEKKNAFVSGRQSINVNADLPPRSRIAYRIPSLAKAGRSPLNREEADLLRYFNILLPSGARPADYLKIVQKWPFVEKAELPPEVSLPGRIGPGGPGMHGD